MASSCYCYDDLSSESSFRLFRIERTQFSCTTPSNEVEIHLFEASFDDAPAWEAVSYAWGQEPTSSIVRCNGKELPVTANVVAVLRILSTQQESGRTFWLDSICIDQFNVSEKNTQVPKMRSIYSEAKLVWIWLGMGSYEVATALDFLTEVASMGKHFEKSSEYPPRMVELYKRFKDKVSNTRGYYDAVDTNFLVDLLNLPWFHRTWPIQELVLAQKAILVCGVVLFPWSMFLETLYMVQVHEHLEERLTSRSNPAAYYEETECYRTISALVHEQDHRTSLSEILKVTRPKLSTKPEDKIYGLYGVFDYIQIQGLPKVDYDRAVNTTYTEMTIATIEIDKSLDILYQVCLPQLVSHLPSWVPDYSNTSYFRAIRIEHSCATGTSIPWYSYTELRLSVRGTIIDEIQDVATSTSITLRSFRRGYNAVQESREAQNRQTGVLMLVRTLQAWVELSRKIRTYPTGVPTREAFYRIITQNGELDPLLQSVNTHSLSDALEAWMSTITANFSDDRTILQELHEKVRVVPEYEATLKDYSRLFGYGSDLDLWPDELKIRFFLRLYSAEVALLQHEIFLNSYHKTFVRTRDGYMGTCPRWVKSGDSIALIQGLKTPFIVRKIDEHYSLIGPAYVEGIMEGERWKESDAEIMGLV